MDFLSLIAGHPTPGQEGACGWRSAMAEDNFKKQPGPEIEPLAEQRFLEAGEPAGVAAADPDVPAVLEDGADEPDPATPLPCVVVGIGASAGGVEAYIELFRGLAPDTGMAFVVIPHLSPDHKNHLPEILGR